MNEENKFDSNYIIKAFENNPISILKDDNKKILFKALDIAKAIGIKNIAQNIQNYDEDEKVLCKAYDLRGCQQDTTFLTSQGVYRLLYNSKKEIAKQFRKWSGAILDDIIFNESTELKRKLEEHKKLLEEKCLENIKDKENILLQNYKDRSVVYLILIKDNLYKFGWSNEIQERFKTHKKEIGEIITLVYCIESKNNILLEQQLKDYLKTTIYRKNQKFNNKNQTELIEINDISIIQNKLEFFNKSIYEDKDYLRIQILKLEIEKLKEERLTEKYRIKQIEQLDEDKLEEQLDNELELELELLPENTIDELEIKKLKLETQKERCKIWYEKNKQKKKEYYKMNKEQIQKQRKEYREQNKDKVLEQYKNAHKKQYEKNKEKLLEKSKEYYKNNKEKIDEINKNNYEKNKQNKKEYYRMNKEQIQKRKKEYRKQNKEELNKKAKEYYQKNKEIILTKRKNKKT
jgi:prophage antirepressor-like protein